ncbi:MAG: hypothetical protein WCO84_05885 [bacterium]
MMFEHPPTITSMMTVIHPGTFNYLWGTGGVERDALVCRIARDFVKDGDGTGLVTIAVPRREDPTQILHLLVSMFTIPDGSVDVCPFDFKNWADALMWVSTEMKNSRPGAKMLILNSPTPGSGQEAAVVVPILVQKVLDSDVTLVIVSDPPADYVRAIGDNPTAVLNPGTISFYPHCVMHMNDVAWPGAIELLKHRQFHKEIFMIPTDTDFPVTRP